MKQPSARAVIRTHCLRCLSADSTRYAHDCLSSLCVLYPAHPFRGRPLHAKQRPEVHDPQAELERIAAHNKRFPKRRAGSLLIKRMCRECNGNSPEKCGATDCALGLYLAAYREWIASCRAKAAECVQEAPKPWLFRAKTAETGDSARLAFAHETPTETGTPAATVLQEASR